MVTIYVELLGEGVQVWRPVQAIHAGGSLYRLLPLAGEIMADETWAFPPHSVVVGEQRDLSDGPALVAVRVVTPADRHPSKTPPAVQSGLDLLIGRGPALDAVVCAIVAHGGIERAAVKLPHDPEETYLAVLEYPAWAVIHAYAAGDFGFKVDLDGRTPRDHHAIARKIAKALNTAVAWPDKRTLAPVAFILCAPDGAETDVGLDDVEPDGFAIGRGLAQGP